MTLTKWTSDPVHTQITFKVKHLMITTVTGHFKQFDINVETEGDDFSKAKKIELTADVNSIDTGNEQRNTHLRSSDFFDVEKKSKLNFIGTKYEVNGDDGKLHGNLTIGAVTKPITLDVEFGGLVKDPWGGLRAGFELKGKLSRKEFGLIYNATLEAGGVVVGDEVKISAEVELVKEAQVVEGNEA
ncbi:MAG: YceI family protein [Ginsengibacter sp.]